MHTEDGRLLQPISHEDTITNSNRVSIYNNVFFFLSNCHQVKYNYNIGHCIAIYLCICIPILSDRNTVIFWIFFGIPFSTGILSV